MSANKLFGTANFSPMHVVPDRLKVDFCFTSQPKKDGNRPTEIRLSPNYATVVSSVERVVGTKPGRAAVLMPLDMGRGNVEAPGNQVFADSIKIGFPMRIRVSNGHMYAPIYMGFVTSLNHRIADGRLEVGCSDIRHNSYLGSVRIIGRYVSVYNSQYQAHTLEYQQGESAHFNPGGLANCLYSTEGYPVFAPYPEYGVPAGTQPAKASEQSKTKACYWTLSNALEYIRFHVMEGPDHLSSDYKDYFPWLNTEWINEWVRWNHDYATILDNTAEANFSSGISSGESNIGEGRKGRDIDVTGMACLDAIEKLLSTAGGYGIFVDIHQQSADAPFKSWIYLVKTLYTDVKKGVDIPVAVSGKAKDAFRVAAATDGNFIEDAENYISDILLAGQPIYVETRVGTSDSVTTGSLLPAWTQDREILFRRLAAGNNISVTLPDGTVESIIGYGVPSEQSFQQACTIIPEVYTSFRLNPNKEIFAGTREYGYPRTKISRVPLTHGLSSEAGMGLIGDYAQMRCRLYAEVNSGGWEECDRDLGLEIWDNGIIYTSVLRDLKTSPIQRMWDWRASEWNVVGGMIDITTFDVRMNLTFAVDHRMMAAIHASGGKPGFMMPNRSQDFNYGFIHSDKVYFPEKGSKPFEYIDCRRLYAAWLRKSSYPAPESKGWTVESDKVNWKITLDGDGNPDLTSTPDALRSDISTMIEHLKLSARSRCRLYNGGALVFHGRHILDFGVGTEINNLILTSESSLNEKNSPTTSIQARTIVNKVVYKENVGKVSTEIHLI